MNRKIISDKRNHALGLPASAFIVIVMILAAAATFVHVNPLGSSTNDPPATLVASANSTAPPGLVHISLLNDAGYNWYSPLVITVVIGINNTVVWTNQAPVVHSISSTTGLFASGDLSYGQSYSYTFTQAGTYLYIGPGYHYPPGVIIVKSS